MIIHISAMVVHIPMWVIYTVSTSVIIIVALVAFIADVSKDIE